MGFNSHLNRNMDNRISRRYRKINGRHTRGAQSVKLLTHKQERIEYARQRRHRQQDDTISKQVKNEQVGAGIYNPKSTKR